MDANGVPTDDLTYTFQTVKNNIIGVTVTLDPEYLAAAERAFPVVIDPTVMISGSSDIADACVCSYTPSTNYQMATQLRTGFCTDYGIRRSYIRFDIPDSVEPGSVINAYMDIEKLSGVAPTVRAYRVTGSWSSGTITWNNKPGYTTSLQSTQSAQLSSGSSWYRMNVTSIVNAWVNGQYINYGFALVDSVENNSSHWTTLYSSDANSPHKPELYINYSGEEITDPEPDPAPEIINDNIIKLNRIVGKDHLVLDLSARKKDDGYYIVTDRWQNFTNVKLSEEVFYEFGKYCDEFLIHAVDVEGKASGIEEEFGFKFVELSTLLDPQLNGASCPNTQIDKICSSACGDVVHCDQNHHKSTGQLLFMNQSQTYYTCRVVGHMLCYYDTSDAAHSGCYGMATVGGKDTIITTQGNNLQLHIQHELSHNLGASHTTCTPGQQCVLKRTLNTWCDACSAAIRAHIGGL